MWEQLKPFCDALWIRDARTRDIQSILDTMVQTGRFNVTSVKHIKSFLSGVYRLALQQGYYEGPNPVRETSLPRTRPSEETYAYSLEEVLAMINAVPEPAATMLATVAFTGVRKGELRGMLWENYRDGEFLISRSIWHGIATEPKSKKSKAPIPIINNLAARLALHRERQGTPIAGPVFQNRLGKPADMNNVLRRTIQPALNAIGLQWHGWHALRRGLATNLHRLGVDDLTIQAILRHSNVSVTQTCYIKTVRADAVAAMEKFEIALNDTKVTPKRLTVM